MINREATMRWKGYDPNDLKPRSNRKVWRVCDECGRGQWVRFFAYVPVCNHCACIKSHNTPEYIASCSGENNDNYGKHPSDNTRQLMSDKGKLRMGRANPMYGRRHSKETKKKTRGKAMARKVQPFLGKTHTEETKQKMRDNHADFSGKNHPQWKGGISFEPYCQKFNDALKQEIRDRYNNCDFISGLPDYICNPSRKLDVHHVDYNKMQGCDGYKWHLIPLSMSNHRKTNFNRLFWNTLFNYALEYDQTYYDKQIIDLTGSDV